MATVSEQLTWLASMASAPLGKSAQRKYGTDCSAPVEIINSQLEPEDADRVRGLLKEVWDR